MLMESFTNFLAPALPESKTAHVLHGTILACNIGDDSFVFVSTQFLLSFINILSFDSYESCRANSWNRTISVCFSYYNIVTVIYSAFLYTS